MIPLLVAAGIGAALGGAKYAIADAPANAAAAEGNAARTRFSPWSGIQGKMMDVPKADFIGNLMKYGTTGAAMASGINKDDAASLSKLAGETPASGASLGGNMQLVENPFTKKIPSFEEMMSRAGTSGAMSQNTASPNPWYFS